MLVDPFDGGRLLTGEDAGLLVTGATGAPLEPSMLTPAEPLDVVMRILNNIRSWAAARPERSDVALWAVELALAVPSHPARLRYERGQLLVRRGISSAGPPSWRSTRGWWRSWTRARRSGCAARRSPPGRC